MSDYRLPVVTGGLGLAALTLSIGWWWLVFGNVVDAGAITYVQASVCLAADTSLCRLAEALCTNTHLFGIRWFAPEVTWAAAALLFSAFVQGGLIATRAPT